MCVSEVEWEIKGSVEEKQDGELTLFLPFFSVEQIRKQKCSGGLIKTSLFTRNRESKKQGDKYKNPTVSHQTFNSMSMTHSFLMSPIRTFSFRNVRSSFCFLNYQSKLVFR